MILQHHIRHEHPVINIRAHSFLCNREKGAGYRYHLPLESATRLRPNSQGIRREFLNNHTHSSTNDFALQEAVGFALKSFPELTDVDPENISFSIGVRIQGERTSVVIGSLVWNQVASSLVQYEILNVNVAQSRPPHISISKCSTEVPPPYVEKGDGYSSALHTSSARSRAPTPTPNLLKRAQEWVRW